MHAAVGRPRLEDDVDSGGSKVCSITAPNATDRFGATKIFRVGIPTEALADVHSGNAKIIVLLRHRRMHVNFGGTIVGSDAFASSTSRFRTTERFRVDISTNST